jgi:hypothetical protein
LGVLPHPAGTATTLDRFALQERRKVMADDKTKQGRDRQFVAGGEEYEVRHFAERHGIAVDQAQQLIDRIGNDREALDVAAQQLKGRRRADLRA